MIYSDLRPGDLRISRVSIGGNIFGYFANKELTADILSCAKEHGLNLIDTSDTYSKGVSEKYIGQAIEGGRSDWIIATKCGLESHQSPDGLGRSENIISKVNQSLGRLKTDYIDIYQMHNHDPITPAEETIDALERCVSAGKIRYYGVSNYSLSELTSFNAHAQILNSRNFLSAQYPFNLLKKTAESALFPWCERNKLEIFVYGALARGILSEKYLGNDGCTFPKGSRALASESIRSDINLETIALLRMLEKFASELNMNLSQLAIKYILSKKLVATAIVGFRDIDQLKDLVSIVDGEMIQGEDLNHLEKISHSVDVEGMHLGGVIKK